MSSNLQPPGFSEGMYPSQLVLKLATEPNQELSGAAREMPEGFVSVQSQSQIADRELSWLEQPGLKVRKEARGKHTG